MLHEGKRRLISAAPFADRVLHHALVAVLEPRFEPLMSPFSFANRVGRGTHAAVAHARHLAQRHAWVLRLDVRQHFASIDHQILRQLLHRRVAEPGLRTVIDLIVDSGAEVHPPGEPQWWPGDDLLAACRPRGLPIGNLTSQFWSNCYLDPLDSFITRQLRVPGYARYVDDLWLAAPQRATLEAMLPPIQQFLAQRLRLRLHESSAQVQPTAAGVPWLGFVVSPQRVRVKARKVVEATRRLAWWHARWQQGECSFGEFDARVQGWIAHVSQADSWRLREEVLARFPWG